LGGLGLRRNRLIEFILPAANLVARVGRQAGKLECRDMTTVVNAHDNRFSINSGGGIQRKREWNLFGLPERQHGTQRKPMLREVAHHSAVGGRKFHVDEGQRAFSKLRPAVGLQGHGNTG
jgi:hypothetical protein